VDHFHREAWLQWLIPGSILIIGLLVTLFATMCHRTIEAARVDACLDSGGSYDYKTGRCDHQTNHPGP
jgi:hypothetical protein